MLKKRTIERMLPVPLTPEEFEDRSIELADKTRQARQVDVVMENEHSDWKARKKVLEQRKSDLISQAARLAGDVATKTKQAPVKCHAIFDFEKNRVAYSREDTQEIVDVREMEPDERQLWIDEENEQLSKEVQQAIDFFEEQLEAESDDEEEDVGEDEQE